MRHHTWNKPKCLVPVDGKPILYHVIGFFPSARFAIVGDYHFETLAAYLKVEPPGSPFQLVRAEGEGTASGIGTALKQLDRDWPVTLLWSDLIFTAPLPKVSLDRPTVFVTNDFLCRWTVSEDGRA